MQLPIVNTPKMLYPLAVLFFLLTAAAATLLQEPLVLVIPVIIISSLYLLQQIDSLFYFLIISIPWSFELHVTSSLSTDVPDEPLMWLTSLSVILWIVTHYKSFIRIFTFHPLLIIILLQVLWAFITVLYSTDKVVSTKYWLAKGWYINAFAIAPLLLLTHKDKITKTFRLLLFSMLVLLGIVLLKHAFTGFSFAGINPSVQPFFINHVNYSSLLVCMVPLLIAALKITGSRKKKNALLFIIVIVVFAVITSYARGAWIALLGGMGSYWLLKKRALLLAYLLFIVISAAAIFWLQHNDTYLQYAHDYKTTIFHTDFKDHLVATYQMKDVSTAERYYRWIAGVRMINHHWLTGYGPTTFYGNYKSYAVPAFKTWVSNNAEHSTVHNYFLLMLIEQGVIGLLLVLLLFGYAFYTAERTYHRGDPFWKLTASTVVAIFTMIVIVNFLSDLIETDKIGSVFYICLATLMIADYKSRESVQPGT